jgi:tetratricopeptide (TPR) repeat protein
MNQLNKTVLLSLLIAHFTKSELQTLCFELGIDHENVGGGDTKEGQARELIAYMERNGHLDELVARCRALRPDAAWQELERPPGQSQLDAMPLDHVPTVAPLPKGSLMPLASNPLFVGRELDLMALARALKVGETAAIGPLAAATGLGGIGKTQLASEFAHRYGQFFAGGVFWLSFADADGVPAAVAQCGGVGAMNLPAFEALQFDDQVARVRQEWQSPMPRLLIFDNCEEETLLDTWRPKTGGCRVLITSRRATWDVSLGVQAHPLDTLPRAESIALLRKFRPDLAEDDPDLDAIAAELGDLPLALHLAGSFLKQYRADTTPAAYLAELRSVALLDHESLQGVDLTVSATKHDLHVGRSFALSYNQLDSSKAVDALALGLLARAAYFAPGESIPRDLLLSTVEQTKDAAGHRKASRALTRLANLGLLDVETSGALRLHRLLAAFSRTTSADATAQPAVEQAIIDIAYDLNMKGYPEPLLAIQSHVRVVTEAALPRNDARVATLCTNLGYHLKMISDYSGAKPLYERALAIREQVLGPNHPDTAHSLSNLAILLRRQGEYAAAKPLYERALAIREQVLGPNHPDTATSLDNLAELLRSQDDYTGAKPLYERALAIREQVLGPSHPDTTHSLNNLGKHLYQQGDYTRAKPLLERALTIRKQELGPNHPDTAASLNSLAELLWSQGDYIGAKPLFERALEIREQVLGPSHASTAHSLNNLAILLQSQGEYAAAKPLYERALAIHECALGHDNPTTLKIRTNLAVLQALLRTAQQ